MFIQNWRIDITYVFLRIGNIFTCIQSENELCPHPYTFGFCISSDKSIIFIDNFINTQLTLLLLGNCEIYLWNYNIFAQNIINICITL